MRRLSRSASALALHVTAPPALAAQHSVAAGAPADSGAFVIRHAGDTVATERFTRSATRLEGTLDLRNARRTSQRYAAVVGPDATLPLIEVTVREDQDSGRVKGKVVQRAQVIFRGDSAAVDALTGHGIETRVFGTARGAVPYLNLSFALLEQAVRRARRAPGGAADVPFFNLGGGQTLSAKLSALGADSLALAIGNVEFHLRVDSEGRVLGGRIPAQDVVAERQ